MVKGHKKGSSGNFEVHIISPWQNLTIRLVLMFSIMSKSTSFLLKLDLHCKLPNFIRVSNTSVMNNLFFLSKIGLIFRLLNVKLAIIIYITVIFLYKGNKMLL